MAIIVTGAGGGIGRATALRLARDALARGLPARVAVVDINGDSLLETAALLQAQGAEPATIVGDLCDPSLPADIVARTVDAFGHLDCLVSNAGIVTQASLAELAIEDYERSFAVNARAFWLLAKAALPHLAKHAGCIVAVASVSSIEPTSRLGAYSASKAALAMMVQQFADECGPQGVRCNAVSPGAVHTPLTAAAYRDLNFKKRRADMVPLRRIAEPEDVADAIAFLAGPDARYVTGVNLVVDGGLSVSFMGNSRRDMNL